MESKHFIFGIEAPVQDLGEGVSRQILGYNNDLMMVKVIFKEGAIGSIHAHVHSQTTYCPEGTFKFTIGEESRIVKAGDAVYIPSGVLHGVVCLQEGALIDTFNPVRQDFL
ncbi:MAG: cupin domain-containing protein [Verrucomicrobiota bacterium]